MASAPWSASSVPEGRTARVRTLIADHDPISRHFLEDALRADGLIDVGAAIDARTPVAQWPLRRVTVVVLGLSQGDLLLGRVGELAERRLRPLVVGLDWTRQHLNDVLAAGAWGCLEKDTRPESVLSGVHAVAHGNRVLSPSLLEYYVPRLEAAARRGGVGTPAHPAGAPGPRPAGAGAVHVGGGEAVRGLHGHGQEPRLARPGQTGRAQPARGGADAAGGRGALRRPAPPDGHGALTGET
nr:hypothetical protein [Streptomyces sp. NRRL WC-3719]